MPSPSQLGNNMIVDEPISSTVIAKSVPLTAIVAVGVLIFTFCAEFFAIWPLAYLTVPNVAFKDNEPVLVLGS